MSSGVAYKRQSTVEDIVNVIANKPSLWNIVIFAWLLLSMANCAISAFFPNFGGYLPYSDWRCLDNSTECLLRTKNFTDRGWKKASAGKLIYLDNRCSIKLDNINTDSATVILMTSSKEKTAEVVFKVAKNKISVTSNSSCPSTATCSADKNSIFDVNIKKRVCRIDFKAGYDSVISCNDSKISILKFGDVYGLKDAISTVRNVKLEGIGSYELSCPDPSQYSKDGMCGVKKEMKLLPGQDFYWYTKGRSTYSIDWKLYCGGEFLRSMIGSIYFGGALLGTLGGGTLYDAIGRKKGALIGYVLSIVATFCSAVAPSVEFFFVCRFFQGCGSFLGMSGMFVLLLEYTAVKHRNVANSAAQFAFAVGYLIITLIGYLIKSWHWLAAATGVLYCVALIPLLLVPESPRYWIVNKNEILAKASLKWLKRINKSDFELDLVEIRENIKEKEDKTELGFMETFKDFIKYRELTIQLVLQMFMWMVLGFLYYGFSFSWGKLGKDLYLSYLFAAIGDSIAFIGMALPLEYFGRKISMIIFFLGASLFFLIAMVPYSLGTDAMTIEQLSCLVGTMFVSAAFGSIYLYTTELAPTTHRGKALGYCSFAARIGSFCGPQAELMVLWNKKATLIIFAILAGVACILNFRLPETKGCPTPNTAEEVQLRRTTRVKKADLLDEVIKNPNPCSGV